MDDIDELAEPNKSRIIRVASTISFPYTDISDAIFVAEGMLKGGGLALTRDQLAAAMGLAPNGGGFAVKVATAKVFGVVASQAGKYQLTDIGHEIVDPSRQREALVAAFLEVELYKRVYDEFRGKRLPPRPNGLEAAFVNFGVSPKNARTARLIFDKSARAAGFFPNGDEDRLVMPFGLNNNGQADDPGPPPEEARGALAPSEPLQPPPPAAAQVPTLHKSIIGMLEELPPPKSEWSRSDQADWLDALANMFKVIYKSDDGGDISVTYIPRITD